MGTVFIFVIFVNGLSPRKKWIMGVLMMRVMFPTLMLQSPSQKKKGAIIFCSIFKKREACKFFFVKNVCVLKLTILGDEMLGVGALPHQGNTNTKTTIK